MKKTIFFLLIGILCAAFFTGCPHETQPEQEEDNYSRDFIFDKEEFDNQRKAWVDAGIKNYSFTKKYIYNGGDFEILLNITVRNGDAAAYEYIYESLTGGSTDGIGENGNSKVKPCGLNTIDKIYSHLENWYESSKIKDLKAEGLVQYGRNMSYDTSYHFPTVYEIKKQTQQQFESGTNEESIDETDDLGWESKIYDFKVLD